MSNNFSVTIAAYPGSNPHPAGTPPYDPTVYIQGTVNGQFANAFIFWSEIQTANISGGISAVQQLIQFWFLKFVEMFPKTFGGAPTFPLPASIPAAVSGNQSQIPVNCNEALVGSWTA